MHRFLLPGSCILALLLTGGAFAQVEAKQAPKASLHQPTPDGATSDTTVRNPVIDPGTWSRCIEEGKRKSRVQEHLDILTNRIGPRLSGSDNLTTACEWARRRFESFGMKRVRLEKWGEFPVGFNRGPYSGYVLVGSGDPDKTGADSSLLRRTPLEFATNAWTPGTQGPQEGGVYILPKGLKAKDVPHLADQIRGRWVFGTRQSWRLSEAVLHLRRALAKAGALGYIAPSKNKYLYWFGDHRQNWNRLPRLPYITLDKGQYEALQKQIQEGQRVRLRFDIRNHFKKGPIPLYNVIAEIRGTEKPDEIVIVGGHIDSWDGATGTTDNGTGAATTLEAARILMAAGARPRRTIRFMLWSAEEQGLLGSKAYVDKNRAELLAKVSAVFVHDGGTNFVAGIGGPDYVLPHLRTAFTGFETIDPEFPFEVHRTKGGMGGGSDHASFLRVGIPGFYWRQKGGVVYAHGWHTQFDTFDLAIPSFQRHSATCIALGALAMANLDAMLPRWRKPSSRTEAEKKIKTKTGTKGQPKSSKPPQKKA